MRGVEGMAGDRYSWGGRKEPEDRGFTSKPSLDFIGRATGSLYRYQSRGVAW